MSDTNFSKIKDFLLKVKPMFIQISGGEPTLHPKWDEICAELSQTFILVLESNGWWLNNEPIKEKLRAITDAGRVCLQIRTHPKYYPDYKKTMSLSKEIKNWKNTAIFDDGIFLYPWGRAKINFPADCHQPYPNCINCFIVPRQKTFSAFSEFVRFLQDNKKFCKPMIDMHGNLHAGESLGCVIIGSVSDPEAALSFLKNNTPCDQCGLYAKSVGKAILNSLDKRP